MILNITGKTLPEVWEKSVIKLWENGDIIQTQYDQPNDPPSRDMAAALEITEPMSEPRIHRCFPGGIVELEAYRQEVVDGIHNHWVDPENGKWEYTYNERLFEYTYHQNKTPINQIQYMIDALNECPYTRRAQAITWKPWEDCGISDPSCLQKVWARVIDGKLNFHVHIRSNDAFKASFMNMYAFTDLQRIIAEAVGVPVGIYRHFADSFHIYGSYFKEFEGFLESVKNRTFEERVYRTEDIADILEEAKEQIKLSLKNEKETGRKGL